MSFDGIDETPSSLLDLDIDEMWLMHTDKSYAELKLEIAETKLEGSCDGGCSSECSVECQVMH